MNSYLTCHIPELGELLLVAGEKHLIGLYYLDAKHAPKIGKGWKLDPRHSVLCQTRQELLEFARGERRAFSVPLQLAGTEFQRKVWEQLAAIPFGETISYSELARRAGAPAAVRAAGSANGKNPVSILIPCHRVISKDGSLGGYAGNLTRKQRLLEIERGQG